MKRDVLSRLVDQIASGLLSELVDSTNKGFANYVGRLGIGDYEVDLLKCLIMPEKLNSCRNEEIIRYHKNIFLSKIRKLKVPVKKLEDVLIYIEHSPNAEVVRGHMLAYIPGD